MFLQLSFGALCSAQTSVGVPYSAQTLMSWSRSECKKKKSWLESVFLLIFTTSIVVHTGRQAVVHTEELWGPDSGPPCPCPSGLAVLRWRCCPPNREGCRSCCPGKSSGSGTESPASRGRLLSAPVWAAAGVQTPESWVSPEG